MNLKSLSDVYARCNVSIIKPRKYEEVATDNAWKKAMNAEIEMIEKNNPWQLVDRPTCKPIGGVKLVYKRRYMLINLSILRLLKLKSRYTYSKNPYMILNKHQGIGMKRLILIFTSVVLQGVLVKLPCTSRLEVNLNLLLCQYMWIIQCTLI